MPPRRALPVCALVALLLIAGPGDGAAPARADDDAFAALRTAIEDAAHRTRGARGTPVARRRMRALRTALAALRYVPDDLGFRLRAARRAFTALDRLPPGPVPGQVASVDVEGPARRALADLILAVATSTAAAGELADVEPDAVRRATAEESLESADAARRAAIEADRLGAAARLLSRADRLNLLAVSLVPGAGEFRADAPGLPVCGEVLPASATTGPTGTITLDASGSCGGVGDGVVLTLRFADSGFPYRTAGTSVARQFAHTVASWSNADVVGIVVRVDDPRTGVLAGSLDCTLASDDGTMDPLTIRNGRFVVRRVRL